MTPPKPTTPPAWPIAAIVVAAVTGCGLIALFTSAISAFKQTTGNDFEAWAKALLIEASIVAEAIVIMRAGGWGRRIIAALGMVVSLTVSITYNYVQAQSHGLITDGWQLLTLSVGPVASMATLGLLLGHLVNEYEHAVAEFEETSKQEDETARLRAQVDTSNNEENDKARAWNTQEANSEREYNLALKDKELEALRIQAEIERAKAAQVASTPPAPVLASQNTQNERAHTEEQLREHAKNMRTAGKATRDIVIELFSVYGAGVREIGRAANTSPSNVSTILNGVKNGVKPDKVE